MAQAIPRIHEFQHLSELEIGGIDFPSLLDLLKDDQRDHRVYTLKKLKYENTLESAVDVEAILRLSPKLVCLKLDVTSLVSNHTGLILEHPWCFYFFRNTFYLLNI